ncbi:MAG: NAD(P)/FAD-dependent oxidoreductase [Erysipelotrichaceae bacterium]|nr:NAD(P)/FAD-dependent oxidoreductase [Erysipelotrichaceae bacterium]
MLDIVIIGAGITGSLIAHRLSKFDLRVLVLEKESDVAEGATGANSAMVHSGHDPKPGSFKCKYNLEGNRMFPDLCKELQVAYVPIGAFVAAGSPEEEEKLENLVKQCEERNVPYEILSGEEAKKLEPNLADRISKVLSLPTTGIVTPWEVTIAAMEEAILNGTELKLNYEVKKIEKKDDHFIINDEIETKIIINCAGAHCDEITEMLRESPYHVQTRKGEYFVLDHLNGTFVNHVIYPVPGPKGKGVLAVPTVHGNVLLGPNSDEIEDKEDDSTGSGLDFVRTQISTTMKNIPFHKMIHTFAGLRPHIDLRDFYIQEDDQIKNFVHVAGIESPGLSAAPAIAKEVCDNIVLPKFADAKERKEYLRRKPFINMEKMSEEKINELIKKDPSFGRIVCRCEKISEGQIRDVINRKCGARTIKAVKMRCRPGMGRCQGGFCEPEVVKILARELNEGIDEIRLDRQGSNVLVSMAKEEL